MNNSKSYLQKLRTYLSTFKKIDKKDKPPKLKIADKKNCQYCGNWRNLFPPFC